MTTDERGFTPVFGPNGAVMNSPSMTPEMRVKIAEAGKIPPRAVIWRQARFFGWIGLVIIAARYLAEPVREVLLASPWWAGVSAGGAAMLGLVVVVRMSAEFFRRWELSSAGEPKLRVPLWARVTLAATDTSIAAALATMFVVQVADLRDEYWNLRALCGAVIAAAAALGLSLRWLAGQRGWTWRSAA